MSAKVHTLGSTLEIVRKASEATFNRSQLDTLSMEREPSVFMVSFAIVPRRVRKQPVYLCARNVAEMLQSSMVSIDYRLEGDAHTSEAIPFHSSNRRSL